MQPRFASRAGRTVTCPVCREHFVVGVPSERPTQGPAKTSQVADATDESDAYELDVPKHEAHKHRAPQPGAAEPDSYELEPPIIRGPSPMFTDEEVAPPPKRVPVAKHQISDEPVGYDSAAAREARLHRIRHEPDAPPKVVFLSGVFDFPIHPGVWQRWIAMTGALIVDAMMVIPTLLLLGVLSDGASGGMVLGLLMGLPTIVISLIALGYITTCLLAVIEDTANGCDQIHDWPAIDWRDWAWSLRLPVVPGLGALMAASLVRELAGEWNMATDMAALVVFPILLLSTLETGAVLLPISGPILKTFSRYWWAWLMFYAESGLVLLVFSWIVRFVAARSVWVALLIAAPLSIATLLIYSRLLGRLAWYTAWEDEEPDEEADEEADAKDADSA
jgi:hypothetical protein